MAERELGMGVEKHITRRTLLGGVAAAGAASLVRPAGGLANVVAGRPPVSSRWVGRLAGTSAPIGAPTRFSLVGVQWTGPAGAGIELRVQAPDRSWSPWVNASAVGHDGDRQPARNALFGEPVWANSSERVQLRSDRLIDGLRVHFVAATGSPAARSAAALPAALPVLDAGPGQPPIIARRAWGAGQARPVMPPAYGSVKLAFVHHTVNPNGYSAAAVPAMLRAIFDYHVQVRGWWDIGYNFVIDAYGRIWEARAGGIDMAVVGAQAGAYNTESTGVAILGDFTGSLPSGPALAALEHLLAWKLSLHGVPALGRVTVIVDPADAFYTPFRPGAHVSLPRVAGHRDGDSTDCPGNALYAALPSIRPRVAALAGTPARLTVTKPVVVTSAGSPVTVGGQLRLLSGQPIAGAPIELQTLGPSGPPATTVLVVTTGANGMWICSLTLQRNTAVRALHRPHPAGVADWVLLPVAPVLTLTAESTSPLLLTGTISPVKRRVTIDLYGGATATGKPLAKHRLKVLAGRFSVQMAVPGPGSYVLVARSAADASNAAGASPPLAVTVS
jgi:N-acetylmuramoyl-L-alanine amidase-like protein